EVEETNSHGFDNTESGEHIVGIYQWVDKIMQAQVYSYGSRLMYDLVLPEPGAYLAAALQEAAVSDPDALEEPPEWVLGRPIMITRSNWRTWAVRYKATDVTPPPEPITETVHTKIQAG